MKNISLSLIFVLLSGTQMACNRSADQSVEGQKRQSVDQDKAGNYATGNYATAYFASGCFWCVEAVFESVIGVQEAISGYSGGEQSEPTYQEVSRGSTKHAEAVKVIYDPLKIDFKTLVDVFFASHDPTTLNKQGPDRGPQYRSIAFYQNEKEKQIIEDAIQALESSKEYPQPIVTEIKKFQTFWEAEDYHQDYERKHPDNPYIQGVSIPRLNRFKAKMPQVLKGSGH